MDISTYCRVLLRHRNANFALLTYLGAKWLLLKIGITAVGVYFLIQQDAALKVFGGVMVGYAAGAAIAGIRSWLRERTGWRYVKQVVNWQRVEELAKEKKTEQSTPKDA